MGHVKCVGVGKGTCGWGGEGWRVEERDVVDGVVKDGAWRMWRWGMLCVAGMIAGNKGVNATGIGIL